MPRRHAVPVAAVAVLHGDHNVPRLHRRVLRPRDGGDLPRRPGTVSNTLLAKKKRKVKRLTVSSFPWYPHPIKRTLPGCRENVC